MEPDLPEVEFSEQQEIHYYGPIYAEDLLNEGYTTTDHAGWIEKALPVLTHRIHTLERDLSHAKAAHDEMVRRNRILRDRPDLSTERLESYQALVKRYEQFEAGQPAAKALGEILEVDPMTPILVVPGQKDITGEGIQKIMAMFKDFPIQVRLAILP